MQPSNARLFSDVLKTLKRDEFRSLRRAERMMLVLYLVLVLASPCHGRAGSPCHLLSSPFCSSHPYSAFSAELDAEHTQKVLEMEHTQQLKLKERQKFFEEAFQQDMEQYLSTGYLQIAERREPMGSMSSMEVNVDMLEQMDLMDISDQEALDVFLNSGGEDNIVLSPGLELESNPCQNEMTLQIPNPSEPALQPPVSTSAYTDLDTVDAPLVQPDEEEVQVDTALVTLHTDRKSTPGVSDDSDSTQDI
nr:dysbindin-like [Meriones unguiculatus]XP_021518976.1 dysbindin-like [Meriones unguiculatus]